MVSNGNTVPIQHIGQGLLPTPTSNLRLSHVLHTPTLSHNLLSISNLTVDNSCYIKFSSSSFAIKDSRTHQIIMHGPSGHGLYPLPRAKVALASTTASSIIVVINLWHRRLGHSHAKALSCISNVFPPLCISPKSVFCKACVSTKGHHLPFRPSSNNHYKSLELLHNDVWGPSPSSSFQAFKYYLLFVDDALRYIWVCTKNETTPLTIKFLTMLKTQFQNSVKILRIDGGGEYHHSNLLQFLSSYGILHQTTCLYMPKQNSIPEHKHRHLLETMHALLFDASLPPHFYVESLHTAAHPINRMPSPTSKLYSPYHILYQRPLDYSHLCIFGCACYPLTPPPNRHKLQPRTLPCVFLGYKETVKVYKCLNPSTGKILPLAKFSYLVTLFLMSHTFVLSFFPIILCTSFIISTILLFPINSYFISSCSVYLFSFTIPLHF